jgi:ATP-dependent DNA helicase RecG
LPKISDEAAGQSDAPALSTPEEQILRVAAEKGSISRKDVEVLLGISQTPAGRLLKKLTDGGALIRNGVGKNIKYYSIRPATETLHKN